MTDQPTVHAIVTQAGNPAFALLDAIDNASDALAPCRAVIALTNVEQIASEQDMPGLRRDELAALLQLLTNNVAGQITSARNLAQQSAMKEAS